LVLAIDMPDTTISYFNHFLETTVQNMAADASFPLTAVKPGFSMMSMTFRDGDRTTVLHLDSAGLSAVGQAIKDTWKPGIQAEQSRCGTGWSFKLNGYPFITSSNIKTSQQSRQMVMQILQIKTYEESGNRLSGCGFGHPWITEG
jgi:hypothetical protein